MEFKYYIFINQIELITKKKVLHNIKKQIYKLEYY